MIDEAFVEKVLNKGIGARNKVSESFDVISVQQLNWKPTPKEWSVAQCLEHLIIADRSYFSDLRKIAEKEYKMSFWERHSPFTAKCGRILKDRLREQVGQKMTTSRTLLPTTHEKGPDFIGTYLKNLDTFLDHISSCRQIDLDKTIITSPAIRIVTYSLRDAFQFLVQHEHRHINQAIRIMDHADFPKKI